MTTQVQVSKTVGYQVSGVASARIGVSKTIAYMILVPGSEGGGGTGSANSQGHVQTSITYRLRQ